MLQHDNTKIINIVINVISLVNRVDALIRLVNYVGCRLTYFGLYIVHQTFRQDRHKLQC